MNRRWLVVAGVVAVLTVTAAGTLALARRPSSAPSTAGSTTSPLDALPASGRAAGAPKGGAEESGSCAGTPLQHRADEVPAEWATHAAIDEQPFALRAPESWRVEDLGGIVAVGSPGRAAVITIMSNAVPGIDDSSAAADALGPVMEGALAGQGATVERTSAIEVGGHRACEQVGTIVGDDGNKARFVLRSFIADGAFHIVYLRLGHHATADDARSAQAVLDSFRPEDAS